MLAHCQRRWPNIETTQGQCHVFAGGGGAHGANRSVTIQPDEGVTDLIVCIHLRLTLPLPQQRAIVVICSAKAVSAHL